MASESDVAEDAALVAGVLARDPYYEKMLVDKYTGLIHYMLLAFGVRNRDDRNDLAQDVFLGIIKFLPRWNPSFGFRFSAAIGQITRNLLYARHRAYMASVDSRLMSMADGKFNQFRDRDLDPEEICEYRRIFDLIEKQSDHLTPLQRSALDIFCTSDMGHKEIAQACGASVRQTKYALQVARVTIKRAVASGKVDTKPTAQDGRTQNTEISRPVVRIASVPKPKNRRMRRGRKKYPEAT